MPIERLEEKFEEVFAKTGSLTRLEESTKRMYSGSASETKFNKVSSKDIFFTVVDLKERQDVVTSKVNNLDAYSSASIDGGTF
jgi:hypothetical protein